MDGRRRPRHRAGSRRAVRGTGASHLEINTMGAGFASVDDHLAALSKVAEALDLTRAGS